ncbi:hypothetical protein NDU88_008183 [Pleurodeles waltl]|uniref:Uncharacterized protein n=1 Tax=Pleurodeles waltl TaxID=8319 RepID=A0AAV7PNK1_PLEWA|nr:hypothetical protein NDU88_008183 [Pleurodeles waltl]
MDRGTTTTTIVCGRKATYTQCLHPEAHKVTALEPLHGTHDSRARGLTTTSILCDMMATDTQHLRPELHKLTALIPLCRTHDSRAEGLRVYNNHCSVHRRAAYIQCLPPEPHKETALVPLPGMHLGMCPDKDWANSGPICTRPWPTEAKPGPLF